MVHRLPPPEEILKSDGSFSRACTAQSKYGEKKKNTQCSQRVNWLYKSCTREKGKFALLVSMFVVCNYLYVVKQWSASQCLGHRPWNQRIYAECILGWARSYSWGGSFYLPTGPPPPQPSFPSLYISSFMDARCRNMLNYLGRNSVPSLESVAGF